MKKLLLFLLISTFTVNLAFTKTPTKIGEGGYKGELPNIEGFFEYKKESVKFDPQNSFKETAPTKENLIKAPLDDSLFLDIIIKKGKKSPYVNDMLSILTLFESFRATLTREIDVQRFNAQVNVIDLHIKNLIKNYNESSFSMSESYIWCQEINYRSKLLGNLIYDSNYYSKYMPIANTQYSPSSIQKEKENLIKELDKAIFILKRLDE